MLVLLALVACAPTTDPGLTDGGTYAVDATWLPDPPVAGETAMRLDVALSETGERVEGAAVEVVPTMPSMGHGIQGEATVVEDGDGGYTASWVWPMSGPWVIDVVIDGAAGVDTWTTRVDVE